MPIIGSFGAGSGKGFGLSSGAPVYMDATGGTIYDTGTYRVHLFTTPGSLVVSKVPDPALATADYMIIGGVGGIAPSGRGTAAGGFRESAPAGGVWTSSPIANTIGTPSPTGTQTLTATTYPITVGAKAAPEPSQNTQGIQGAPSTFNSITSAGGGGSGVGHYSVPTKSAPGLPGGCGGSGGGYPPNTGAIGGNGNVPPTAPPQGNNGAWNGGGGALSAADSSGTASSGQGAGTEIAGGMTDVGVPGPSAPLRYFAGGNGQGGSGDGSSNNPGPTGPEIAYGSAGASTGAIVIRYQYA